MAARDGLNPTVFLSISGTDLGANALQFVESVTVELALDKADMITLSVANPIRDQIGEARTSELLWTNSLAWAPGNVVEVGFSYGDSEPPQIFAGILKKWRPRFPRSGTPKIQLKAFDGSVLMMDSPTAKDARTFDAGVTLSDMAMITTGSHGIDVANMEFNETEPAVVTIKKAGMTDYQFVKGIGNLLGWQFYVRWNADRRDWDGFMGPRSADRSNVKRFVWGPDFEAGDGDGILLDFEAEFATQNASTDVEVFYYDRDTLTWEKIVYPEEDPDRENDKPEFEWKGDNTTVDADLQAVGTADSARGLRIKAGGVSVEVVPAHGFKSAEEAVAFAKAWWLARQDLLLTGKGSMIGWPELAPGQVHELGGIGPGLDGEWFFAEVTHRHRKGAAYECSFVVRKVIP